MKIYQVGDWVRVRIDAQHRQRWAYGAADALNGLTGVVAEIGRCLCVEFDQPAPTWWAGQTPARRWWFEADELQSLQSEAAS